jgi:hypothetical protein
MTSPAAAAILDGMPDPRDLRRHEQDGMTWVSAGPVVLACYPAGDIAMRNVAVAVARQLGFPGQVVAGVMGLSENYVATLRQRALREGAAGLVRPSGPKPKLGPADWARARGMREAGASEAEVAARLGVAQSTVSRHLGGGPQRLPWDDEPGGPQEPEAAGIPGKPDGPEDGEEPGEPAAHAGTPAGEPVVAWPEPSPGLAPDPGPAVARVTGDSFASRHAGAMLLHAFGARAGAGEVLAAAAGDAGPGGRRFADVALLSAASIGFALGAATVEQFKQGLSDFRCEGFSGFLLCPF